MSARLLLSLARQRMWLAGIGLAVLSYVFQSIALDFGPLSLVQPLIVSELVFAIPLSARLRHMRLGVREWLGVAAVTVGLAIALAAAQPRKGNATATLEGWLATAAAVAVVTTLTLLATRLVTGTFRASLLAFAGGVMMGFQAALLAVTVRRFNIGIATVFAAWQTYLLVAASVVGVLLIQSAFQAGPLAASAPVIDATEPAVAITIGVALFGETVRTGWPASGLTALGLGLLFAGIVSLDTSPVLETLQREEERDRPDGEGAG